MGKMYLIYTTLPTDKAEEFAKELVESGKAVCANIIPVKSFYIWKGRLERDDEAGCLVKALEKEEAVRKIREIHPYEIPFIGVMEVEANDEYIEWGEKKN